MSLTAYVSRAHRMLVSCSACRYGHEVARLTQALAVAKKGYDIARRGGVAAAVLQDIKVDARELSAQDNS